MTPISNSFIKGTVFQKNQKMIRRKIKERYVIKINKACNANGLKNETREKGRNIDTYA